MARYIFQLRRGHKVTASDGTVVRDDWAQYTMEKPSEAIPREGELVLEYDNGIPRLKIGDGIKTFAELEYMSIDSFIKPKLSSITLKADAWTQCSDNCRWSQAVTVDNAVITPNSKIDLQPSAEQLAAFHDKEIAFVTENEDGIVTIFCIGQKPDIDCTIQTIITEVALDG